MQDLQKQLDLIDYKCEYYQKALKTYNQNKHHSDENKSL